MATQPVTDNRPQGQQETLVPPDEAFWKRYSPHHEFAVAGSGSVTLHVLGLGLILLVFFASCNWDPHGPAAPPQMSVVEIQGSYGGDGLGEGQSLLSKGKLKRQEIDDGPKEFEPSKPPKSDFKGVLQDPKIDPIKVLDTPPKDRPPDKGDVFLQLSELEKQIDYELARAGLPQPPVKGGAGGKGTPKKGPGLGTGTGDKPGPGGGKSQFGKVLTKTEKRQSRWKLILAGSPTDYVQKLKSLQATLIIPTGKGVFTVYDLTRTPPAPKLAGDLREHSDKIWWRSHERNEMQRVALALRLPQPPQYVAILLPKRVEDRMAEIEQAHQGAAEDDVEETVWDVPRRDGHFASEPAIVQQILRKR
jgi:hypothetical protein